MRRSRLLLACVGGVACLGVAFGARRALTRTTRPTPAPVASASLSDPVDPVSSARARLEQFEVERRRATDFAHLPPANLTHGADPYALVSLDATHLVGVLRGASALVLLDAKLHELARVVVPGSAVTVTVTESGECWVAGETSPHLLRFRFDGRALVRSGDLEIPGVFGVRALAAGPAGALYALDAQSGKLLTLDPRRTRDPIREARVVGHGPLSLRRVSSNLVVDLLLDHALLVFRLSATGQVLEERARIHHDGPIWGFDAAPLSAGELLITATGVEDRPLDRSDGSFGFIDSFAFSYLLPEHGEVRELWRANVSELGVVTPKAPLLDVTAARAHVYITGYGSDRAAEFFFDAHAQEAPRAQTEPFYPGTSAGIRLRSGDYAFANPLLDAWVRRPLSKERHSSEAQEEAREREESRSPAEGSERRVLAEVYPVEAPQAPLATSEERLGEALFFTTLMAPSNSSEGSHSRFSCETCHFEGYGDGRVHYTGRDDVRVTTKPLRGLFNNRPHFSRALDADLATVSHHEFRVAGKGSGQDPWFEIKREDFPWLAQLGVQDATLGAEALRRALIAFLMRFSHTTNPAVVGRTGFDATESRGAAQFREHCARCHAARLQSDVPESALPFEAWQTAIFSPEGALVWASAEYQKTGVVPYVHESGTRVPSLRRVYAKWPHFTNGSADTLQGVLERARFDERRFFHDHAPEDGALRALTAEERRELLAFLELL